MATDHEIGHGREITWTLRAKEAPEHIRVAWSGASWIVEVNASGLRNGKPFVATHLNFPPACAPRQKPCCNWCEAAWS